jgi:hypothetical protein
MRLPATAACAILCAGLGGTAVSAQGEKAIRSVQTDTEHHSERPRPSRNTVVTAAEAALISRNIKKDPKLQARVRSVLPEQMTIEQAAYGFRNQGQFIAAVHASKNHGIPFMQLKQEMTGAQALSLGRALEKLKPVATTGSR